MGLKPVTVSQLNSYIKRILQTDPILGNVSVRGEVSNLKFHGSGHVYFSLKDEKSRINCFLPSDRAVQIGRALQEGMEIIASGYIYLYERGGSYSLNVTDLEKAGQGKLAKEGLFDQEHKKLIPAFPHKVAIVTSETGAAVRDILKIIQKKNNCVDMLVYPVLVQGPGAPQQIADAIRDLSENYPDVDTIITGRGGGSMEELWAFNEEVTARAIFASEIPVISAVGHEPDFTIADFVADLRAPTPSGAAELAVPNAEDLRETLRSYDIRMTQAMRKQMTQRRAALENLAGRRVLQSPAAYFDLRRVELDYTRSRLIAAGERYLASRWQTFAQCAAALDAMSPLKVLGRGYAVASDAAGTVLRSAEQVQPGDAIRVQLQDGALHCTVNNREEAHGKTETDL